LSESATPVPSIDDKNATVLSIGGVPPPPEKDPSKVPFPTLDLVDKYRDLKERFSLLSFGQKLLIGIAFVFFISTILVISLTGQKKDDYRILFSSVNQNDGAAIIAALQQLNVPYKFTEGGGAIMVPESSVYETRLKLAGQGLPKAGNVGFELLENQKLGTSQFVEQVNYQRGLEGELAKSISSLAQVKAARVMLAIPKQTAFMREQERPTASVVVTMHPGRFLDEQAVAAITNLVGSSVPNMGANQVTIIDSEGSLLAPNPRRTSGLDSTQLKYVGEVEGSLSKRVIDILEPVTGKDNVKATVTVDMSFNESERIEETYGRNSPPNASSIRSQQSTEASTPTTPSTGIPGATTNQPPGQAQAPINNAAGAAGNNNAQNLNPPPGAATTNTSRRDNTINYELDRAIQSTKGQKGQVRRVSAAVVLNLKPGGIDDKGKPLKPVAYTTKEIDQIKDLVRDAVGFDDKRGDSVSVANIAFRPDVIEDVPFYREPGVIELAKEFFKFAIILGSLALVFFSVVKPLLFPRIDEEEAQNLEDEFDEKVKAEMASMSPQARERKRMELELERERKRVQEEEERSRIEAQKKEEEESRKRQEESKKAEYDELVKYAFDYVTNDPRVVAGLFKQWLSEDATKANAAKEAAAAAPPAA
jgi:flagellar M-ring protein FliF